MRYRSGGSRSLRRTLPSNVPLMGPTPTFIVALYSPGPIASSPSQPGIAFDSVAGSRNASQTRWRGTGMSVEPSIFMASPARERAHSGIHSRHALLDGLETGGIRQANVLVRSE